MKIARVRNAAIGLPVVTLTQRDRTIILIGMLHVAEARFFNQIQKILCKCEDSGFGILYENVNPEFWPHLQNSEALKLKREVESALEERFDVFRKWGLEIQTSLIKIKDSWKSADIDSEKLCGLLGLQTEEDFIECSYRYIQRTEQLKTWNRYDFQRSVLQAIQNPYGEKSVNVLRDSYAANQIATCARRRDVVSFWGTAHLPGIIKNLEKLGFTIKKTRWLIAMTLQEPE